MRAQETPVRASSLVGAGCSHHINKTVCQGFATSAAWANQRAKDRPRKNGRLHQRDLATSSRPPLIFFLSTSSSRFSCRIADSRSLSHLITSRELVFKTFSHCRYHRASLLFWANGFSAFRHLPGPSKEMQLWERTSYLKAVAHYILSLTALSPVTNNRLQKLHALPGNHHNNGWNWVFLASKILVPLSVQNTCGLRTSSVHRDFNAYWYCGSWPVSNKALARWSR